MLQQNAIKNQGQAMYQKLQVKKLEEVSLQQIPCVPKTLQVC